MDSTEFRDLKQLYQAELLPTELVTVLADFLIKKPSLIRNDLPDVQLNGTVMKEATGEVDCGKAELMLLMIRILTKASSLPR